MEPVPLSAPSCCGAMHSMLPLLEHLQGACRCRYYLRLLCCASLALPAHFPSPILGN